MNTEFFSNFSIGLIISKAFINLLDAYIAYLFCVVLFNKRSSLKTILMFCFTFSFANLCINLTIKYINPTSDILVMLIVLAIIVIIQKFILRITLLQAVILLFINSILLGITGEIFSSLLLKFISNSSILKAVMELNIISYIFASLLVNLFQIIVLFIIKLFKVKLPVLPKISKNKMIFVVSFIIVTTIIITINYYIYFTSDLSSTADKNLLILFEIVILIFAGLSTTVCIVFIRFEAKDQELTYQRFYNSAMDNIITDLRSQTHNFDNVLASIGGYIQLEMWDELEQYFLDVAGSRSKLNSINYTRLLNIKNAGLLGILISKLEIANGAGLEVVVNIIGEVSETRMRISHLCEIVGILFDNAIEAAIASEEKKIILSIQSIKGSIHLILENSINEKPEMNKIFIKGWSSKGTNRGLGLYILKGIMNKYRDVVLKTKVEKDLFIQELIVN